MSVNPFFQIFFNVFALVFFAWYDSAKCINGV